MQQLQLRCKLRSEDKFFEDIDHRTKFEEGWNWFCGNEYWTRVWIVQEFLKSKSCHLWISDQRLQMKEWETRRIIDLHGNPGPTYREDSMHSEMIRWSPGWGLLR